MATGTDPPKKCPFAAQNLVALSQNFQENSDKMIKDILFQYNKAIDETIGGYMKLQDVVVEGRGGMDKQAKKANEEMLKNLGENYKEFKQRMQTNYDENIKSFNDMFTEVMAKYKKEGEEVKKKHPTLPASQWTDGETFVMNYHKGVMDGNEKRFKSLVENLEKKHRKLIEDITIPQISIPNFNQVTLTKAAEAQRPRSSLVPGLPGPKTLANPNPPKPQITTDMKKK